MGLTLEGGSPSGGWVSPGGSPLVGLSGCPAENGTSSHADLRSPAWKGLSLGFGGLPPPTLELQHWRGKGRRRGEQNVLLVRLVVWNFLSEQTVPVGTVDAISHSKHSCLGTEALGLLRLQAPSRLGHQATRGRHLVVQPNLIIAFASTIKCRTWTQPTFTFFLKTRE